MVAKTNISQKQLLRQIGISSSKFYSWNNRYELPNNHNSTIPKKHWILDWEKEAIIKYAKSHPNEGYRRLTYMMIDDDIVAVSPSTTYRVLKQAGLLNIWNRTKKSTKGTGFVQPEFPHQHWHTDIKYVNFKGTFLFLISVIDGYSRYIVHHELRMNMQEYDVQLTIEKAIEKFPGVKPRLISDNGSQYISKDFAEFIKLAGLQHIRTSIAYPQANGKIEIFHKTLNNECLKTTSLIDLDDARKQIAAFIEKYNTERLHSALFYLTPEDFLLGRVDEKLNQRNIKLEQAKLNRYQVRNVV
jgi:transposase InsO family protein